MYKTRKGKERVAGRLSDVWRERDKTEMSLRTLEGLDKQNPPNWVEFKLERVKSTL